MPITHRCNYAGPLGKLIPTRSLAFAMAARLRELVLPLPLASLPLASLRLRR